MSADARARAQFGAETDDRGRFVRQVSRFRDRVTADGSSGHRAEPGRYHLYVSRACPWAHRAIIVRRLKRLEDVITMSVVDPVRDERGWAFREGPGHGPDPVNGFRFLSEAYTATAPDFSGRVTVPVLWDRETGRIVNNESAEIVRMLNREWDRWGDASLDLYPQELRDEIDAVNDLVYRTVNNGVYRAGFATTQEAYEEAFDELFATLDDLDRRLGRQRYLAGDRITEADWRLFTTLVRFDAVYALHFKCNLRRIADYEHLAPYLRELFQHPGVADTVDFDHIKRHYYLTHDSINPTGIVPKGPELDLWAPHGRGALPAAA
ncbi:glutathione S-transferase family protein [Miltoncostaea marina]|uniref:glutathione S-transferase family protein n=1 Tax=Miltoncostaea marina TaxID=2843215 RepID=UPI001C3D4439|nr:glutathione S-transferase family protein [Miltoncostaea marina]